MSILLCFCELHFQRGFNSALFVLWPLADPTCWTLLILPRVGGLEGGHFPVPPGVVRWDLKVSSGPAVQGVFVLICCLAAWCSRHLPLSPLVHPWHPVAGWKAWSHTTLSFSAPGWEALGMAHLLLLSEGLQRPGPSCFSCGVPEMLVLLV